MAVTDWELFEAGKRYNNALTCIGGANYYDLMDLLIDFFNGNQWRNLEVTGLRKPVINIVQKAVRYWVASLTSSNTKIDLEPLEDAPGGQGDAAAFASAELASLFEKFKIDNRLRDALFKAGIMGDCAAHLYFDPQKKPYGGTFGDVRGELCFELVNGTNVFFGNANNPDAQAQPYIIISGRDLVKNLRDEARRHGRKGTETNAVTEDKNTASEAGPDADIEVQADGYGKATYILVYKKTLKHRIQKDALGRPYTEAYETVTVSKCVENAYIYKEVDTGLSVYPVAWLVWDKQENQYHGRPPCAEILETQIFINLMFAMIMLHLMMTAFPKAIYNADVIEDWTNQVGQAIPVKNLNPGESIRNFAAYLEPGQMSGQITAVIEMAVGYARDALGLSDAALGEVDPEQASGTAILATAKQSSIPLENTKANLYEFVEDLGRILLDMMAAYYGERPVVMPVNGVKTLQSFDFSRLRDIWLGVRVDVGTTNVWSDAARKQTITNLMNAGKIELIDWLERMDDADVPNRQGLIAKLRQTVSDKQLLYGLMARFVESLPPESQQALEQLRQKNPDAYERRVKHLMGGEDGGMPGMRPAADGGAQFL